jgi:hypothetical protein
MKNPIFILGAHKSGTSLLRSLFDGHPALFSIPLETHIFQLAHYWVDYRFRSATPPILKNEHIKEQYLNWVKHYNNKAFPLADANIVGQLDLSDFEEIMYHNTASFKDLVKQYFQGIYYAIYDKELPLNIRIVEKSVEHAEFAFELRALFPDAIFIHIIRNPYANLVSLRRKLSSRKKLFYPFLGKALLSLNNSYYYLEKNSRLLNDYLVIRYEDLLQKPEDIMLKIANFVKIEFNKFLLQPTILGKPWHGNSSRGIEFSGISSKNMNAWRKEIKSLEVMYVNRLFSHILKKYNYKKIVTTKKWIFPEICEYPHIYILNRAIRYFF